MLLEDAIGRLSGALADVRVDQDVIDEVVRSLSEFNDLVEDQKQEMGNLELHGTSLGGTEVAENLSFHHRLARRKMTEVVLSMSRELEQFGSGLREFGRDVQLTDDVSASDLRRIQAELDEMAEHVSGPPAGRSGAGAGQAEGTP